MEDNLINSFVDIFSKYYKFYYDHKLSDYMFIRSNKLYQIFHATNNNYLISLYSIYFNNQIYYDNNDIEMFRKDVKTYIINNYDNIGYMELNNLYHETIQIYYEEMYNFA
jgi:hypothetical protein